MTQRKAPVQGEYKAKIPAGTIDWAEHEEVWEAYAKRFGTHQSAERIAERGGFGYSEIVKLLNKQPTTWAPHVPE